MNEQFEHILKVGSKVDQDKWTLSDVLAKMMEEAGEFSKAIQVKVGKIVKEQPDDEDFMECADVMNTMINALARANGLHDPAMSVTTRVIKKKIFMEKLRQAIDLKCDKWENSLGDYRLDENAVHADSRN